MYKYNKFQNILQATGRQRGDKTAPKMAHEVVELCPENTELYTG